MNNEAEDFATSRLEIDVVIGNAIEDLMREKHFTLTDIVDHTGLDRDKLSKIVKLRNQLAAFFESYADYLEHVEDPPF